LQAVIAAFLTQQTSQPHKSDSSSTTPAMGAKGRLRAKQAHGEEGFFYAAGIVVSTLRT
jgi:hypothetical protein